MVLSDLQMAYASFRATRVRLLLTILGIAIGVASILLVYALGQGLTKRYSTNKTELSENVIVVTPGKVIQRADTGRIEKINISALLAMSNLSEQDIDAIEQIEGVSGVAPVVLLSGAVKTDNLSDNFTTSVVATNEGFKNVLAQRVKFGSFFGSEDSDRYLALIGKKTAENLFQEESPIGRMFDFRGREFVVKGVFDEFIGSSPTIGIDYNSSVFIPIEAAKKLSGGGLDIREIKIRSDENADVELVAESIKATLLKKHSNIEDFTIYKKDEYKNITEELFGYVTAFVTAVAGISLFVGGIGIMNIMFVSVTERTKEIGIRKALGATGRQILGQFLVESIILSTIGGAVGIILALLSGYIIALQTTLSPSFSLILVLLSMALSIVVGTVFGIAPAIKASRQDPIKSLRHH